MDKFSTATIYLLAMVAGGNYRSKIRSLTHDQLLRINYLLRCPNPGKLVIFDHFISESIPEHPLGKLVIQDIIPAIELLRKRQRIRFSTMFSQELLFGKGVIPGVEFGELQRSDEFFDSITYK